MRGGACSTHVVGNPKRKRPLGEHGNERVILKCVVNMRGVVCGMVRVAQDVPVAGCCEHCNDSLVP
jgi:hypothetical protein